MSTALNDESLFRLCIMLTLGLIVLYTLCGHIITSCKLLILHESTVGVLTGIFAQWLLLGKIRMQFDTTSFFFFLLPPIVFASAYTLKKKNFVRNLSYIFGLGVLGTICAMIIISILLLKGNQHFKDPESGESWI